MLAWRKSSTAVAHQGSGLGNGLTSKLLAMKIPLSFSNCSSLNFCRDCWPHVVTLSAGYALYGYQMAAATLEVVEGGSSFAQMLTVCPASSKHNPVVRPETPHNQSQEYPYFRSSYFSASVKEVNHAEAAKMRRKTCSDCYHRHLSQL